MTKQVIGRHPLRRHIPAGLLAAALSIAAMGGVALAQSSGAPPTGSPTLDNAPPNTNPVAKPPFATPDDAIVARQAGFKNNGHIMDAIKNGLANKTDVKQFAAYAHWMADWGKQIPDMFPAGSEHGHDTKALPAIWANKDEFAKDATNFSDAAAKLAQLADSGDTAGFAEQYRTVGGTCGACHRSFRAR